MDSTEEGRFLSTEEATSARRGWVPAGQKREGLPFFEALPSL